MYTVQKDPPPAVQDELQAFPPLVQKLLFIRGITTKAQAESFFAREWHTHTDPFLYSQMERAVERTIRALQNGETIGIYHDYDCDGIPGAAALFSTLRAIGGAKVVTFVPNRNEDGFGLNERGIQKLHEQGVTLLFTIDCGTSDPEMVAKARSEGMDVIILDHHLAGTTSPNAYAIINPVLEDTIPLPHPCGAGCVFKFLQALLSRYRGSLPEGWEKWQLDLVGIATLSDMVPLFGENRLFVHFGLSVLRKSPRPGIVALCQLARVSQKTLTEDDIAFTIAPRINAASRMGDAHAAFALLIAEEYSVAVTKARYLQTLNEKRKRRVATILREANKRVAGKDTQASVWVFGDRSWEPSLAGLVAQKILEEHGKTIFVWGHGGGGIKGSCRSVHHNTFSMMQEAQNRDSLFVEFGGHSQAGGFQVVDGNEVLLEERLNSVAPPATDGVSVPSVDFELPIGKIGESMAVLDQFAPFGCGNKKPLVALRNCRVVDVRQFGRYGAHTKYQLQDDTGDIEGISFFTKPSSCRDARAVLGHLEHDTFKQAPRIRVTEIIQ